MPEKTVTKQENSLKEGYVNMSVLNRELAEEGASADSEALSVSETVLIEK